ncbi:MAG: phosphoribosyltransferase [Cyanobacteria bacterium J06641_5]
MADLHVSWSEYREKIERLAIAIYRSGWQPDAIVCLAKGGLRVGDVLCRLFDVPLAILSAASYDGRDRGEILFSEHLSMTADTLRDRVLLADDLADSGASLRAACAWLEQRHTAVTELKTATLWCKAHSVIVPDYYVEFLADNPWIHQPFEVYESMTLAELAAGAEGDRTAASETTVS